MPGPHGTPLLDDFNRANGAPGANWGTDLEGALPTFTIASNQLSAAASFKSNYWATSFPADQEAWMTIAQLQLGAEQQSHIICRVLSPSASSGERYMISWDATSTYLEVKAASNVTVLQNFSVVLAVGNKIGLSCIGNQIKGWIDTGSGWTQLGTTVINSVLGNAGYMGFYSGNTVTTHPIFDDFGGGSIGTSVAWFTA